MSWEDMGLSRRYFQTRDFLSVKSRRTQSFRQIADRGWHVLPLVTEYECLQNHCINNDLMVDLGVLG